MTKIKTRSGRWMDPLNPLPLDIVLVDIAHGLALTCRFAGQCQTFYSVAEHCVRMSLETPPELALDALIHDCAEAYIADLSAPVKRRDEMKVFRDAEDRLEAVIRLALGLPREKHDPRIKYFDEAMYATEARDLMFRDVDVMEAEGYPPPFPGKVIPWPWEVAKQRWLDRWEELRR